VKAERAAASGRRWRSTTASPAGRTALLARGGRVLLFAFASGEPTPITTRDLDAAASGRLVPEVGARSPLADAAPAHRALDARETVGKVVLQPPQPAGDAPRDGAPSSPA
jgi:NADPH:quinone reductase-like Zn-dependent oxidoreductase